MIQLVWHRVTLMWGRQNNWANNPTHECQVTKTQKILSDIISCDRKFTFYGDPLVKEQSGCVSITYHFKKDNLVKSNTSIYIEFTIFFIRTGHSFMVTVIEIEISKVFIPPPYLIIRLNDTELYIRNKCKNIIVLHESSPNFTSNHFWFPCC